MNLTMQIDVTDLAALIVWIVMTSVAWSFACRAMIEARLGMGFRRRAQTEPLPLVRRVQEPPLAWTDDSGGG